MCYKCKEILEASKNTHVFYYIGGTSCRCKYCGRLTTIAGSYRLKGEECNGKPMQALTGRR